jgi:hypothetical protein
LDSQFFEKDPIQVVDLATNVASAAQQSATLEQTLVDKATPVNLHRHPKPFWVLQVIEQFQTIEWIVFAGVMRHM